MEKLYKEVIRIVAMQFEVQEDKVDKHTNLELELGADSVDMIMFVIELENRYNISFPEKELPNFYSPHKAVEYLKAHI